MGCRETGIEPVTYWLFVEGSGLLFEESSRQELSSTAAEKGHKVVQVCVRLQNSVPESKSERGKV